MKKLALLTALLLPLLGVAQVVPPAPVISGKGYIPLTPEKRAHFQRLSHAAHGDRIKRMAANQTLPPAFDARVKVPLPVGDQGQCGSCYLYSTIHGTATCALLRAGWGKADNSFLLAVQYGMDRPRNFGGCDGGNGTEVIDWAIKHGWPCETYIDDAGVVHNDYPKYSASSSSDRMKPGAKLWLKDASWGFVNASGRPTTDEIKAAVYNFGRLNVSLDAGGQFSNGTGTITALGNQIDHEIQICAYDDAKDGGCFLLENQWNTSWGLGGYRWVTYKASQNLVDVFFVSATPLPPPTPPIPPTPPVPPNPGTFVPPYYLAGRTFRAGPFADVPTATVAAQKQADLSQAPVTIQDSRDALVATIQPTAPAPVPSDTITVTKPGVYRLVTPKTAEALDASGLSLDDYVTAVEQFRSALGIRFPRPSRIEPPVLP